MDSCHTFTFYGFEIDNGAKVLALQEKPKRKMEFFGDSVSCGEVSEAVEYAGKPARSMMGNIRTAGIRMRG